MAVEIRSGDDGYKITEIDWTQAPIRRSGDRKHIVSITRSLTDLREEVPFLDGTLPDIQRISENIPYSFMDFEMEDGQIAHAFQGDDNNELGTQIFMGVEVDDALEIERLKRYLRLDEEHILWTRVPDADSINK